MLVFEKLSQPVVEKDAWPFFKKVVQSSFLHRRKTIYNALLLCGFDKEKITRALERAGVDLQTRPEKISLLQFKQISQTLSAK